jgi:Uma2 family endonuclease
MASVLIESGGKVTVGEDVRIPADIATLADFRAWALSNEFPEAGRIEVDMSPEDFFTHGTLKAEISTILNTRVKRRQLGYLVIDSTRISDIAADLSAEPDVVFIAHETFDTGRARLVPKASRQEGRYVEVEVEGAPDLVVEIVSDSSVAKDTRRLPPAYFGAGIREFWLADARGEELVFVIHARGADDYEPVPPDTDGFQRSEVMGCRYRLDRTDDPRGHWQYDLIEQE